MVYKKRPELEIETVYYSNRGNAGPPQSHPTQPPLSHQLAQSRATSKERTDNE